MEDSGARYQPGNFFQEAICRVWFTKIVLWSSLTCSVLSLLALNFERYLAVVHPIFHKTVYAQKKIYSRILVTVLLSLGVIYKCSYAILSSKILSDGRCTVYTHYPNKIYQDFISIFTLFFEYVLPLVIIAFFYGRMALKMHNKIASNKVHVFPTETERNKSTIAHVSSEIVRVYNVSGAVIKRIKQPPIETQHNKVNGKSPVDEYLRARNNILKTSFLLSLSFVVCWTSNECYYVAFQLGINLEAYQDLYRFGVIMVFSNCCLNPIIYCSRNKQFQKNLKHLIKKFDKCQLPRNFCKLIKK